MGTKRLRERWNHQYLNFCDALSDIMHINIYFGQWYTVVVYICKCDFMYVTVIQTVLDRPECATRIHNRMNECNKLRSIRIRRFIFILTSFALLWFVFYLVFSPVLQWRAA